MITSAFTCTGPYAILILLGIKRVENRVSAEAKPSCRRQALDIMGTILFKPYQDLGEGLFFDN